MEGERAGGVATSRPPPARVPAAKRALIVEPGQTEAGLAAARALAEDGWVVGLAAQERRTLAGASKHVARTHRIAAANLDLDRYVGDLNAAIAEHGYEVVLPGADVDALALSLRREEIAATVPYGPHESVLRSQDKRSLNEAAEDAGLGVPATREGSAWRELPPSRRYVVKAALHAPLDEQPGPEHLPGGLVREAEVDAAVSRIEASGGEAIVQERIEGPMVSLALVADHDSRIVARIQQTTQTLWPPEAGMATRARSTAPDPVLFERAQRLLDELAWSGLAQLQFLIDRDRGAVLIDFNGRFYLSLGLATAARQNLAATWARLAIGLPPPPKREAEEGVTWQWLEGDLKRAWRERRGGLAGDLLRTIRWLSTSNRSIWEASDPNPALARLRLAAADLRWRLTGR